MSLTAFVPTNTQKARTTAIAAFKRMLEEENVSMEFVQASILLDKSGKRLAATMDRCGFYLATNEGKKDKSNFLTCPLHALAIALATQDAPCSALLNQLPNLAPNEAAPVDSGAPLLELLEAEPASLQGAAEATSSPDSNASSAAEPRIPLPASTETQVRPSQEHARTGYIKRGEDGVQSYVNRLLKRVAEPAGSTVDLTSHSFRRGGAQHANGDDRLAAQWIFDRGAWDMTKTSKAFAYITNTAREDRKVARVLSGWSVDDAPKIIDIKSLDHASQERLGRLRLLLFSSCTGLKEQRLNVSTKVLNVLTAYLVRYYPQMKELAPAAP
ncbi:hypothetical protein PC113_g22786 [Phytophthora cactorum]|uniref:Uncharacterized protein n=1 Tax=Phytophthora cactorum TaxID=29920 RepID=A0A8T0Y1I7_9STRA|nr:hypothetical protein PC113_g22786 [Phytophthora cactorum]